MKEESEHGERVAIGISLGNCYSSIGYTTQDGKAEVIANEEGDRQIPTVLSYVDGEEFHGTQAKAQLVRNPRNTITYFRDYIGQPFKSIDPSPSHDSARPKEHGSSIAYTISDTTSEENDVLIAEVMTRHLRRLKASASDFLGKDVNAAVMTVPTNFTDAQKEAVDGAAKGASLNVLQFINEPIAACLAYDARPEAHLTDKVVVVADFGGTRSDVAVISSRGGMYTILATAHDYEFGGSKLDDVLAEYVAKEFQKKHKLDPRQNERSLAKLRLEAEVAKKALSLSTTASLSVESLVEGIDFAMSINRTRFDLLGSRVFAGLARLVSQTVSKADLDVLAVNEVILAGGTSHIPKLVRSIEALFSPTTLIQAPVTQSTALNPSELSVRGAAIQASLVAEFDAEDVEQSTHPMVTVTPHLSRAIGVLCISPDESKGAFRPIIEADTPVPVRRTAHIAVPARGGDVLIKLCEGYKHVQVIPRAAKPTINGAGGKKENAAAKNGEDDKDADDDDADDDDDEEVPERKEIMWRPGVTLAEIAIKDVKKGKKVEVQVNVGGDMSIQVMAREANGKGGVRGSVEKPAAE